MVKSTLSALRTRFGVASLWRIGEFSPTGRREYTSDPEREGSARGRGECIKPSFPPSLSSASGGGVASIPLSRVASVRFPFPTLPPSLPPSLSLHLCSGGHGGEIGLRAAAAVTAAVVASQRRAGLGGRGRGRCGCTRRRTKNSAAADVASAGPPPSPLEHLLKMHRASKTGLGLERGRARTEHGGRRARPALRTAVCDARRRC